MKAFGASRCASRQRRIDSERTPQLAGAKERVASLEKEKADLAEALAAARAEAKSNAEAVEAARQDARAAEEVKASAEKAKVEAEETRKIAEDACTCEKDIIQRWRTTISSALDLVQADMHGLLGKFALDAPRDIARRKRRSGGALPLDPCLLGDGQIWRGLQVRAIRNGCGAYT